MKKIKNALFAILSTAWYAALTFFCFTVFGSALFMFADRFLYNNIVACVILGIGLITITAATGNYVKKKAKRKDEV